MGHRHPKISIIIPAANEEAYIGTAIDSVRQNGYRAIEIIVVVNGASDHTALSARRKRVRVITTPRRLGYSGARNRGAKAATGAILVFLDADSTIERGALEAIATRALPGGCGTLLGAPRPAHARYRLFFLFKNLLHRFGLYHGVLGGCFFCDASLFRRAGGYDEGLDVDEHRNFIGRCIAQGGHYTLLTTHHASTSMRRFEQVGMLRVFFFWCSVRAALFLHKRPPSGKNYAATHEGV